MLNMHCHREKGTCTANLGANALDGIAHVHMLVDGHDVWGAGGHALQEAAAAADVQDDLQVRVRLQQHCACEVMAEPPQPTAIRWRAEPS